MESHSAKKAKAAHSIEVHVPAPQISRVSHPLTKLSPQTSARTPAHVAAMVGSDSIILPTSLRGEDTTPVAEGESIMIQVSKQHSVQEDENDTTLPCQSTPQLPQNLPATTTELQTTPSSDLSDFPEEEVHLIATSPPSPLKYEIPPEYSLGSQPAASSLVSPPESTHTDTERTPPAVVALSTSTETAKATTTTPSALSTVSSNTSRQSSRRAKTIQRYTPESGTVRRASSGSIPAQIYTGSISGSSLSDGLSMSGSPILQSYPATPTTGKRRGSFLENNGNKRRGSSALLSMAGSPTTAEDEESLRLIRELQAQDYGLRRRTGGKSGT